VGAISDAYYDDKPDQVDAIGDYRYELFYYPDPENEFISISLYNLTFSVELQDKYILYVGADPIHSSLNFCRVYRERYDSDSCNNPTTGADKYYFSSAVIGTPLHGQASSLNSDNQVILESARGTSMNFPEDDCSDDSTGCDLSQHGRWNITIVYPGGEDLCANSNICRGTFELEIIYICRYPAATLRADATLSSLYTTANTEYDWPQKKEEPPTRTEIVLDSYHTVSYKWTNDLTGILAVGMTVSEQGTIFADLACPDIDYRPDEQETAPFFSFTKTVTKLIGLDGKVKDVADWDSLNADILPADQDVVIDGNRLDWWGKPESKWSEVYIDVEAVSSVFTVVDADGTVGNVKLPEFKISFGDATSTNAYSAPLQNMNSCKPISFEWVNESTGAALDPNQSALQDTEDVFTLKIPRSPLEEFSYSDGTTVTTGNLKFVLSDTWKEAGCREDVVIGLQLASVKEIGSDIALDITGFDQTIQSGLEKEIIAGDVPDMPARIFA